MVGHEPTSESHMLQSLGCDLIINGIVLVDRVVKYASRSRVPGGRGGDENSMDIESTRDVRC